MARIIDFQGRKYAEAPAVGLPTDVIIVSPGTDRSLTGAQQVEVFNLVSANLGRGRVKRFADAKKGAKRTWGILVDYAQQVADEAAIRSGTDSFEASPDELAAQKPRQQVQAERKAPELKTPPQPAVVLSDKDKAQISDEAALRKSSQPSDSLLAAAAAAGAKTQAQSALRTSPPASGNAAKDAEMPALRKAVKPVNLEPKAKVYPRKAGSKQAILVDLLSRPQGATFGELYDGLAATGKPWKGVTIRSGLAWDINHIAGYGVASELLNGEAFAKQGRAYEAARLGVGTDGYDPELKLAVYRLTYPKGQDAPLPHTAKKA